MSGAMSNKLHVIANVSGSNEISDSSTNDGDVVMEEAEDVKVVEKIAHRETRYVTYLRLGLLLTLLTAAAIVSTAVFLFVSNGEEDEFETAFVDYSTKLTETFQSIIDRRLGAVAAFSTTVTSFALASNVTWPFMTIAQYEAQARHFRILAGVTAVAFSPIVSAADREEWESIYVPNNVDRWKEESLTTEQLFSVAPNTTSADVRPPTSSQVDPGMPDFSRGYSDKIYETVFTPQGVKSRLSEGIGPFMPWWQTAPYNFGAGARSINLDLDIDPTFNNDLIEILSKQRAALGRITNTGYGDVNNPSSGFYYPVLDDIADNSTTVASLGTLVYWLPYFADVLPQSANGLVGVIRNTCNQSFTFRIDGSNVTYIGEGDLHDPKYDYLKQEVAVADLINKSIQNEQYLGLPLNEEGCQYTLAVYASSDMEDDYKTNKPVIFTVVSLLIFLVTSMLFLLYDRLVERRQRLVMSQAESSGAIVASLFPAAYRDRLMASQAPTKEESNKESRLQSFLNGGNVDTNSSDEPIADLFPECTVMFADIAGFTRWSSTREPAHVFCLLQEVYRDFDVIAKRLRVFKVETIGDCYMAVAGLPMPQPNHARLMARFANECVIQMRETLSRLVDKLGEDTTELALRVGLHSGPVTAGILRGEKSRFQLFGDTVNTASRMESTGEKNRIQVSDATAELIRQAGKGHWLTPREDLVEAKGKGKLQTYWLIYERGRSTISSVPKSSGVSDDDSYSDDKIDNKYNTTTGGTIRRQSVGEVFEL